MAFPAVDGTATTNGDVATTTPVVNLPASIGAGNTLVALIRVASLGAIGWPAGWTEMVDDASDASDDQTAIAWRKADGTEGATITLSCASGKFAAIVYDISGATDPTVTPPQLSTVAIGSSTTPNPTTCTPTGGAKDYLWLWLGGWEGEQTSPPASVPTNFTNPLGADTLAVGTVALNCRVASARQNLNAASLDAAAWTISVTDQWSAWTMAVHPAPAGGVSVTPGVRALVLTLFAPIVTASDHKSVTPGVAALVTSRFAPTVTASDHKSVTPTTASLVTTRFAPTVATSDHKLVTPGVAALTLATFAPTATVAAGGAVSVTPTTAALTLTAFAPTVVLSDHKLVTPLTKALALSAFAPTVTATDHKLVVPGPLGLTLTGFAPTVTATGTEGPFRLQVPIGTSRGRPVTVRMPYG